MTDFPECDSLATFDRLMCRGEITPHQRYWLMRGERPEDHLDTVDALNGTDPVPAWDVSPTGVPPEFDICQHRGEDQGKLEASASCGCNRTIYACPLHRQCVSLFHPALARPLIAEARRRGLQNCAGCPDFTAVE